MARPKKTVSPKKSPPKAAVTKRSAPAKSSPVKGKQGKRGKKAKDPNAPKRAKSGYMFWLAEVRPRLTKPGMSVTDVTKAAGLEWGTIKDKTKWDKMAADDKKRYEKEMTAYKKK